MTTTEFWLAWLFNFKGVFVAVAIATGLGTGVLTLVAVVNKLGEGIEGLPTTNVVTTLRWMTSAFLLSTVIAAMPDAGDLWKLRVNLLKLEVASPENVQKLGGHVEDVVRALECKHLGVNCPPQPEKGAK